MIGVIVPAHNEEKLIVRCIDSIRLAAQATELESEAVDIVVACDRCTDRTAVLAQDAGARVVQLRWGNVGRARALGAKSAIRAGARWLAFTDADSVVLARWLVEQLALQADAVCGTVAVADWESYGSQMDTHFQSTYTDRDGHRHIHGANLGVSAEAYRRAGGFKPLVSREDVALVRALVASGARIAWSAAPRVTTSARRSFRAPGGFGATLQRIDHDRAWEGSSGSAALS